MISGQLELKTGEFGWKRKKASNFDKLGLYCYLFYLDKHIVKGANNMIISWICNKQFRKRNSKISAHENSYL